MSRFAHLIAVPVFVMIATSAVGQVVYSGPEGAVFDTLYQRYLIANWNSSTIVQIDQYGSKSYFATGTPRISGLRIVGDLLYGAGRHELVAYRLSDGGLEHSISVPGTELLNALVTDTSGNLYVTDGAPGRIYRFQLSDHSCSVFVDDDPDLPFPIGLHFDPESNRLIVTTRPGENGAIHAVDLPGGEISTLATPDLPFFGYITQDNQGRYYVSCHPLGWILRWDQDFAQPVEVVLTGYPSPTQIYYNLLVDTLVIPEYAVNRVEFVSFRDPDEDDIPEYADNCPETYNPSQADLDIDGIGDACDECTDSDGDGHGDPEFAANTCPDDNCPDQSNGDQGDLDADGVGNECDNCLFVSNPGQDDADLNGIGDACEGCCLDRVGDANGVGGDEPTIGDISVMIDAKFIAGTCDGILECFTEADVNQSGGGNADCDDITIGDISTLIDYLFITGSSLGLPNCL